MLGILGEFDRNLVAIETALASISARGNWVQIEGEAEAAARARDVLTGLYDRIERQEVDAGGRRGDARRRSRRSRHHPPRRELDADGDDPHAQKRSSRARRRSPTVQSLARDDVISRSARRGPGRSISRWHRRSCADHRQRPAPVLSRRGRGGRKLGPARRHEGKVDPYFRPLYDALHDCLPPNRSSAGLRAVRSVRRSPSCAGGRWPTRSSS